MKIGRVFGIAVAAIVALVVVATAAHAAAGEVHGAGDCLACAACEWLSALFS